MFLLLHLLQALELVYFLLGAALGAAATCVVGAAGVAGVVGVAGVAGVVGVTGVSLATL